jgi:hypothetical protein
MSTYY